MYVSRYSTVTWRDARFVVGVITDQDGLRFLRIFGDSVGAVAICACGVGRAQHSYEFVSLRGILISFSC